MLSSFLFSVTFLHLCNVSVLMWEHKFLFLVKLLSIFSLITINSWMVRLDFVRGKRTALLAETLVFTWQLFPWKEANTILTFPVIQREHHKVAVPFLSSLWIHILFDLMAWSHKQIFSFSFTEHHQDCLLECLGLSLLNYYFFPPSSSY